MAIDLKNYAPALAYGATVSDAGETVTGNVTVSGTLGVTGVATFTSAPVFTAAPTGQFKLSATASGGTTRTLTAANSGSLNLFDSAAGITYTLPAPSVGLYYDFLWTTLQTSSAHVVVTDAGTTFLQGSITMFSGENVTPSATLGPKQFAGNGSSHVKTTTNGTTTGGGIGGWMRFVCTSATLWTVTGVINSPSGSLATPFST